MRYTTIFPKNKKELHVKSKMACMLLTNKKIYIYEPKYLHTLSYLHKMCEYNMHEDKDMNLHVIHI